MTHRLFLLLALLLASSHPARAYPVGPPVNLDQLTTEADVIFKGTARTSAPVR